VISTADLMLGNVPLPPNQSPQPVARDLKPASKKAMTSYELNAHKPCAHDGCSEPRHRSRNGRCHTTLCTMHYKLDKEQHRK
jgi:hypothetical protein